MTTTAEYRKLAAMCADALDWSQAAKYFDLAADLHPGRDSASQLARVDINMLRQRARSCRTMQVMSMAEVA
jgi:hypothetical protein